MMLKTILRFGNRQRRRRALRQSKRCAASGELLQPLEPRMLLSAVMQEAKLLASDAALQDQFGGAVAIDGDLAVVGAIFGDGVTADTGSAYVFRNISGTWTEQAELSAGDGSGFDLYGFPVAISGETIVIGARWDDNTGGTDAGSAYVYVLDDNGTPTNYADDSWLEQQRLEATDASGGANFGVSVAIDGDTIVVGQFAAPPSGTAGSAYVFERSAGVWTQQTKLFASDGFADDQFGRSVDVSGTTLLVGADQGDGVALNAGAAYAFILSAGVWSEQAKLSAGDGATSDGFGTSVSLDGDAAIVGAPQPGTGAGAAYVFDRSGSTWTQDAKLTASDAATGAQFGFSVSLDGGLAAVGAPLADDPGALLTASGAGYVFAGSGASWSQVAKITASDAASSDVFGISVAVSGDAIIVGAPNQSSAASLAGAAYVFRTADVTPPVVESVEPGADVQSLIVQLNNDDLDTASATDVTNYRITAANGDADNNGNPFDDGDEYDLNVTAAVYDSGADQITVQTDGVLFDDVFRFQIDGDDATSDGTGGVTDVAGNHIAGGDYVADFDLQPGDLVDDLVTEVQSLDLATFVERTLTARLQVVGFFLDIEQLRDIVVPVLIASFKRTVDRWTNMGFIMQADHDSLIAQADYILEGLNLT